MDELKEKLEKVLAALEENNRLLNQFLTQSEKERQKHKERVQNVNKKMFDLLKGQELNTLPFGNILSGAMQMIREEGDPNG